jgi:hypothetical protein
MQKFDRNNGFWEKRQIFRQKLHSAPQGKFLPLGEMFTPLLAQEVNTHYCSEEWRGE